MTLPPDAAPDGDFTIAEPAVPLPEDSRDAQDILRYLELATPAARLGFWQVDLDEDTVWWSPEVYRIHGVDPNSYQPELTSAIEFYYAEDIPEVQAMLDRVMQTHGSDSFDLRIRRRSGETRYVRSAATFRQGPDGSAGRIIGTFLDITYETLTTGVRERLGKLSASGVLSGRERIEMLLEHLRWAADADVAAIYMESGEPAAEAVAHASGDMSDTDAMVCFASESVAIGDDDATLRLYSATEGREIGDVQRTMATLLASMIRYEMVLAAHNEQLATATASLQRREQELQIIFETAPIRVWYKNAQNRILRLNKAAAECMGISVDEALRKPALPRYPGRQVTYHNDDADVIQSRRPRTGVIERHQVGDDGIGWARTDKIPFADTESGEQRLLVVSQDVSDMIRYQELLEKQAHDLSVANQTLDEFAYIASHDLRSPMRAISQIAQWLEQDIGDSLSEQTAESLDLLTRRVKRMETMLADILTYSRAGRQMGEPERVDLNDLVEEIKAEMAPPDSFEIVIERPLPVLHAPRNALKQILTQLIDNALKHHDRDAGKISLESSVVDDRMRIDVTDDGPGIDDRYHQRVFRMFETLAPRDAIEGTGVGLAVVRRLAHALRGEVMLATLGERGCTFTLRLPANLLTV